MLLSQISQNARNKFSLSDEGLIFHLKLFSYLTVVAMFQITMDSFDADKVPFEDPNKRHLVAEVSTKVNHLNEMVYLSILQIYSVHMLCIYLFYVFLIVCIHF